MPHVVDTDPSPFDELERRRGNGNFTLSWRDAFSGVCAVLTIIGGLYLKGVRDDIAEAKATAQRAKDELVQYRLDTGEYRKAQELAIKGIQDNQAVFSQQQIDQNQRMTGHEAADAALSLRINRLELHR